MVLALVLVAQWSRYTRSSFLEVIHQDYIRTARSKGLSGSRVLFRHAFPNAVSPLIALAGVQLPWLFSGALVTETIFGWPGMGRLFVDSLTMETMQGNLRGSFGMVQESDHNILAKVDASLYNLDIREKTDQMLL